MDIEAFYSENEARRNSAEFEFGSEWTDKNDNVYELSWVEATGELYVMLGPEATVLTDQLFGDALAYEEPIDGLLVKILATITTVEEVEETLIGWEDAMLKPNSIDWLLERFPSAAKP
jgi:hypothetical protein